ncbi:hypothetical protein ACLE20_08240 [Rhizobium sp. YIM 134829]|uniref:hypothetical protein n=1 Tax=Rhizobium sp. YIM 134829 TaxID=3390453 RepID=UPI00397B9171
MSQTPAWKIILFAILCGPMFGAIGAMAHGLLVGAMNWSPFDFIVPAYPVGLIPAAIGASAFVWISRKTGNSGWLLAVVCGAVVTMLFFSPLFFWRTASLPVGLVQRTVSMFLTVGIFAPLATWFTARQLFGWVGRR